jgi:hypothetical protein
MFTPTCWRFPHNLPRPFTFRSWCLTCISHVRQQVFCVCVCPLSRDHRLLFLIVIKLRIPRVFTCLNRFTCVFSLSNLSRTLTLKLKVICVIKQRKKKGNVYLSLLTHFLHTCLAILLTSVVLQKFPYIDSLDCQMVVLLLLLLLLT